MYPFGKGRWHMVKNSAARQMLGGRALGMVGAAVPSTKTCHLFGLEIAHELAC